MGFDVSLFAQQVAQCPTADILHDQVRQIPNLGKVIDRDNIAVFQAGGQLGLALEAFMESGLIGDLRQNYLDRHLTPQASMIGLIDLRHAAFTYLCLDRVSPKLSSNQWIVLHVITPNSPWLLSSSYPML